MLSFEYVRCDKTGDAAGKGKTGDATGKTGDTASSGNKTGDTASSGKGKEGGTDNKGKGKGAKRILLFLAVSAWLCPVAGRGSCLAFHSLSNCNFSPKAIRASAWAFSFLYIAVRCF